MSAFKELLYDWMGGNEVLFRGINDIRGETYDKVMTTISELGDHSMFPFYCAALAAWVLLSVLFKFIFRKKGIKQYLGIWFGIFVVLAVGYVANGAVILTIKHFTNFERPYIALRADKPLSPEEDLLRRRIAIKYSDIHVLEEMDEEKANLSFPSGHVAFTVFMLIALWPVLHKNLRWLGIFFVALVGWSRISLGAHFPADLLGAILITTPLMMVLQGNIYKLLFKLFGLKC